jgi:hypothetical protein
MGGRIGYSHIDRASLARKQMRVQAGMPCRYRALQLFSGSAILRENGIGAGTDLGLTHLERACSNSLQLEKSFGNWRGNIRRSTAEAGLNHFVDVSEPHFIGRAASSPVANAHRVAGSYQRKLTWNCLLGEAPT